MNTLIDADFVERAADPAELERRIDIQRRKLAETREDVEDDPNEVNRAHLGRALQRLSRYLRLRGDCAEALQFNEEAAAIWEDLGRTKAAFVVRLRRQICRARLGEEEAADRELARMIDEASTRDDLRVYLDFVHAYRAHCRMWQNRWNRAAEDLRRALELREERGNVRHVEETRALLARVIERASAKEEA